MKKDIMYQLSYKEFKELFDTYYPSLCLFANKYIKNVEISKDIVQEVFIKVWENKVSFLSSTTVKSYFYIAVKNKSLDYLKSNYHLSTDICTIKHIEKIETESYFLREVVIIETSKILDDAINTLPYKCSQIIKLSLNEYSNKEIATKLSITINTVKTQKKIAYQKLRPLLKGSFFLIAIILN